VSFALWQFYPNNKFVVYSIESWVEPTAWLDNLEMKSNPTVQLLAIRFADGAIHIIQQNIQT
jgi:hypothetical protein